VRVSLAAQTRGEDSIEPKPASPSDARIHTKQQCLGLGLNFEALASVRSDADIKRHLQQSYPYRLLTHGISLHQQAAAGKETFSLKKWLREQCSDLFRPAWLPVCTQSQEGLMVQGDHQTRFTSTTSSFS
jgi:hypothetical protein